MKIVIPGGSGQIGTLLARRFHALGHHVTVLSRRPAPAPWNVVHWDGVTCGAWIDELEHADVVINLAGRSVDCRYTTTNRDEILQSRVASVRAIGAAIRAALHPPALWLQASTATIYSHRYDAANDEISGLIGGSETGVPDTWNFSIDVATTWEAAASAFHLPHTRLVLMRSAMTMSPDRGGVFDVLLNLTRRGLGGTLGDGRQFVSWIHEYDFLNAVDFLIDHPELDGPVNLTAPYPLPNADFMSALRTAAGTPFGLPASRWMLEIGSFLMRTETELVLKSRRVVPTRLLQSGFEFQFPDWPRAAVELCRRSSQSGRRQTRARAVALSGSDNG